MKKKDSQKTNICCIGAGYVGGPTMSVIAEKCPYITINVVDLNQERIAAWNKKDLSKLPVFEPGLSKIIEKVRGKNLFFSTDIDNSIAIADIVFICVNTPTKVKGLGAGRASDLKWVESCARRVASKSTGHTIVVEKSTMPVRTAETIKIILQSSQPMNPPYKEKTFSVLSNPEFLAEGTAIKDLEKPDRVLIGGDDEKAIEKLAEIYRNWVDNKKILKTNLWSSELTKLSANAFLAQRISSINSISAFCEVTGGNIIEVSKAIGTDKRIGKQFLRAGPGFGGSCFKKDILNLVYLSEYYGLNEVANYWQSVINLNNWQNQRISRIVIDKLFGTISGKSLAILGFSFKANTNDTRESPSINIAKDLLEEGAKLRIHDPKVSIDQIEKDLNLIEFNKLTDKEQSKQEFSNQGSWIFAETIEKAFMDVDAVLVLTEWEEYTNIQWKKLSKLLRTPAWVFDVRSIVEPNTVIQSGLQLWRIGEGSVS